MIQITLVVTAVLSLAGGAAAFLLVIWPSIRSQERRAARLERWLDSSDGEVTIRALKAKLTGLDAGARPISKEAFLSEVDPYGDQGGVAKL
jgi:hypothetical protein